MGLDIGTNGAAQPSGRVMIMGGGLAGCLLALALGRAGRDVVVFDSEPQPYVRPEKLDGRQTALLRRLRALSCFEPSIADPIAALRAAWPAHVRLIATPVRRIETSEWLQEVETVDGERILGRLLVMTTGETGAGPRAGLVVMGDASDMTGVLADVRLLSRTYVPRWLVTPGMHRRKVAAFDGDKRRTSARTGSRQAA